MQAVFNLLLLSSITVILTGCPWINKIRNKATNTMNTSDGVLDSEKRDAQAERINAASEEVIAANANPNTENRSKFNTSINSHLLFDSIDDPSSVEDVLASKDNGFNFSCEQGNPGEAERFQKALRDFNYNATLIGVVMNMNAYRQIRLHEKGLEQVPVEVARNAFLAAYEDKDKAIVLPRGSKSALKAVKIKYDKLAELKTALAEVNSGEGLVKDRRDKALRILNEYESLNITGDIDTLIAKGIDPGFKGAEFNQPLSRVRDILDFEPVTTGGIAALERVQKRELLISHQIELLESKVEKNFNDLVDHTYQLSGNATGKAEVQKFFSSEHQAMMDSSIEVTGWKFDPHMKFDLIANVIEARPDVDAAKVYSHIQAAATSESATAETKNSAYAKAITFFDSNTQLENYRKNDFFYKNFGAQIKKLESGLDLSESSVGEVSSFRMFMTDMCAGKLEGCSISDQLSVSYRDDGPDGAYSKLLTGFAEMVQVDINDPKHAENKLSSIAKAKEILMSKYPKCVSLVAKRELLDSIKLSKQDYIRCDLLSGVISTSGFTQICGDGKSDVQGTRRPAGEIVDTIEVIEVFEPAAGAREQD